MRVIHLTDAIQCSDAPLQAAIAHIKSQSDNPNGIRNDFEEAAAYLLQFCPVSKKRKTSNSERTYNISSVTPESNSEPVKKRKVNKGKTGVELRYYKPAKYRKLNSSQIDELRQWRIHNGLVKPKEGNKKGSMKDQVIAAIKEISKQKEENDKEENDKEEEMLKHFISSVTTDGKVKGATQSVGAVRSSKGSDREDKSNLEDATISAIIKHLR